MERVKRLKEKMESGKLVKGFFLTMADPVVSEIAGFAGYDYVWIDAEHGPLGRQEILHHIMAAQGSGCAAFVRVPGIDRTMLKAILDMGPDGIIFPFTNSGEIAKEAVRACSYPDFGGVRGQGPIRAIRYGLADEGKYIEGAYEKVLKIAQIETMEGYENLDEILEVDGIDSLFIGAADLSRSIRARNDETDLNTVYEDICRRVRRKGRYLGAAIGATKQEAQRVKDLGVQWVVFGQDARALADALKSNLDEIKDY
ncbi:MAG TPA: host specificity protein [Candidatus Fimimorpha excrementavium]|nr:host specificity protein [Candidatus Fimimorpha excrementavium]